MSATLGAIKIALTWAFAGSAAGFVLARLPSFNPDLPFPLLFAPLGFAVGVIFSAMVAAAGRRHTRHRWSLLVAASLGAVSGLLLSVVIVSGALIRGSSAWAEFRLFAPPLMMGGAVCAIGTALVARRAGAASSYGGSL